MNVPLYPITVPTRLSSEISDYSLCRGLILCIICLNYYILLLNKYTIDIQLLLAIYILRLALEPFYVNHVVWNVI